MEHITDSFHYHKEKSSECYFIGDILSSEAETYHAFHTFMKTKKPEDLLYLKGNYQVVVCISDELYAFADLGNIRPLYYEVQDEQIRFSSHLLELHKQIRSPINRNWFHRSLLSIGFHTEFESPFETISAIPGGFGFYARKTVRRLFQSVKMENKSYLSLDLARDRLQEELTSSVLLRCKDKRITTDLSGGLDSSTLTWIAAKRYPVNSLTLIGKEENEDIQIARKIVKEQSNISHVEFSLDEIPSIYSNMDDVFSDNPIPFYWSASQAKWLLSWAKNAGSDVHFSGEGGDTVLGADYTYLIDLVQNGKLGKFLSHARGWAKEKKQSPLNWILGTVLRFLHLPYHPKQRHPLSTAYNQADWIVSSKKINHYRLSKNLGLSQTLKGIHYLGYVAHGLRNLAEQEEVSICFPYLDHNVFQICMQVALADKMTPYELKPLLKIAFQDELPKYLLKRNTKGDYTSDVYQGMEENFSWFKENFQEMVLADMGLIDIQQFQKCFIRLMNGVPVKLPEFHHTLSLEMWLRHIKKDRNEVNGNASMFT
ncbi:asparagine synthase [Shimazuella alba]|uniref:asparagine synthase (glutamine-hydrolyzing) n=1 Tax=Shimazuella alba TaxID=2690964 RepID=A0A6I4VX91_9BACL|nr:asparagine synthase [Shimazuella alba]MXQ55281.1 hypothetical protein [Shimazuella alba]